MFFVERLIMIDIENRLELVVGCDVLLWINVFVVYCGLLRNGFVVYGG